MIMSIVAAGSITGMLPKPTNTGGSPSASQASSFGVDVQFAEPFPQLMIRVSGTR